MSGEHNTADWLTRGRTPEELDNDSYWWNGPPILYKPIEEWGLKFKQRTKRCCLERKKAPGKITVKVANTAQADTATHGTVTTRGGSKALIGGVHISYIQVLPD